MIIAGVGARSVATVAEIVAAVTDCCQRAGIELAELGQIAGLERSETLASLRGAAARLNVELGTITVDRLRNEAHRCVTHSERAMTALGVPSVAEAAALAAAGPEGILLLPRAAFATVTIALAVGPGGFPS